MTDFFNNKMDLIIMIVLSLLVAFIIGFNIIQIIDNKLNSVTINVPPNNCSLPPIYLNLDKHKNNLDKNILINDLVTNAVYDEESQFEKFGNLPDHTLPQDNSNIIASVVNSNKNVLDTTQDNNSLDTSYDTQDPDYNTLNNIPLLVSPDLPTPNQASPSSTSYYSDRIKLIDNSNGELFKLSQKSKQIKQTLNDTINKCKIINNTTTNVSDVNNTFNGYNTFVDLKQDSYANVTSIGKSMLTPFTSYPLPS